MPEAPIALPITSPAPAGSRVPVTPSWVKPLWPTLAAADVLAAHLDGSLAEMAAEAVAGAFHPSRYEMGGYRTVLELRQTLRGAVIFGVTDTFTITVRGQDVWISPGVGREVSPRDARAEALVLVALSDALDAHHAARRAIAAVDGQHAELEQDERRRQQRRARRLRKIAA